MKDWTVMVYMAGDNNLSENMAHALFEIESFASHEMTEEMRAKMNLVTYLRSNSLTAPTIFTDHTNGGPKRHFIERGSISSPSRLNAAEDLLEFVRWCVEEQQCRARNYMLIFSGHSFGFHGTGFLNNGSLAPYKALPELRETLEQVCSRYLNGKIAILGFDSCLMGMLEVGCELEGVAETLIASEGSLPNAGWGYTPVLRRFVTAISRDGQDAGVTSDSEDDIKNAAEAVVESFIEHQSALAIGGRSVDLSAWDLSKIQSVAQRTGELAMELNHFLDLKSIATRDGISDRDLEIYSELRKIILQAHYNSQTYMNEQCVDLKDLCRQLIGELSLVAGAGRDSDYGSLIGKCQAVVSAISACVLKCGYAGDEYQYSNGIACYFPWTHLAYSLSKTKYERLRFNSGDQSSRAVSVGAGFHWNMFLSNYLEFVTRRPARGSLESLRLPLSPTEGYTALTAALADPRPSRSNPPWYRGEDVSFPGRVHVHRNFELGWDIFGFADDN